MASVIYKEIEGKIVSQRCDIKFLADELAHGGWSVYPDCKDRKELEPVIDSDGDGSITKEEADTNDTGKLSPDEIRAAAKEAGIEKHATARIKTLEAALWPNQK